MKLHDHVSKESCGFIGRSSLKEEQSYKKRTVKKMKYNQHFKLLFFTINLDFITSNQISSCKKLIFVFTSSIYLVALPLEMQRIIKQTKAYHTFFFTLSKNKWPKNLAAAKIFSFSLNAIGTTCFNECFLIHMITRRHYFL